MIRGIIFDCFGVLYSGSLTFFASKAPTDEGRQEVYDVNSRKDYGYISYQEYLEQTGVAIGLSAAEVDEMVHKKHVRNDALVAYVRELKEAGYTVGLLSNMGEQTYEKLFPEDSELFDQVLLSYQEGIVKPHPAIYEMMADRMGLSSGECVMIDDLEANCDGAEIAGMQSIQHITNERTRAFLSDMLKSEA